MNNKTKKLDARFEKAITNLSELQKDKRYVAAFIFGSVAEGTSNAQSDLDAMVVVDSDNDCDNINHPTFDDYKMDLTFRSSRQIKALMKDQVKQAQREPNLVRGVILFDKTGELTQLQMRIKTTTAPRYQARDHQLAQSAVSREQQSRAVFKRRPSFGTVFHARKYRRGAESAFQTAWQMVGE